MTNGSNNYSSCKQPTTEVGMSFLSLTLLAQHRTTKSNDRDELVQLLSPVGAITWKALRKILRRRMTSSSRPILLKKMISKEFLQINNQHSQQQTGAADDRCRLKHAIPSQRKRNSILSALKKKTLQKKIYVQFITEITQYLGKTGFWKPQSPTAVTLS